MVQFLSLIHILKELSGVLIDIHGQHDSQQLLQTKKHLEILDDFAGEEFSRIKREIKEKYQFYRKIQEKLAETDLDEREKERQLSLARFEVEEIENASLKAGEDEELEKQYPVSYTHLDVYKRQHLQLYLIPMRERQP